MRIFARKIFLLIPDITLNVLIRHLILNAEFVQRFYVSSSLDPCLWTTLFAAYLLNKKQILLLLGHHLTTYDKG